MDELTLDGEIYLSSKRAAKVTGYAKDYIGQLCREGRVEARLVGRNWYVLETSIREHRFGPSAESKKTPAATAASSDAKTPEKPVESSPNTVIAPQTQRDAWNAWTPPVYATESTPVMIPTVSPKSSSVSAFQHEPFRAPSYNPLSETPNVLPVVEEMQSAWKDWFTRREERLLLEETPEVLLESPEIVNAREPKLAETSVPLEESIPVTLEKVSEAIEHVQESQEQHETVQSTPKPTAFIDEDDEIVRIRRSYTAPKREYAAPVATPVFKAASALAMPAPRVTERKVIETRITTSIHNKRHSSVILKLLFVLFALVAAGTAILGSGKIDQYLVQTSSNNKFVQVFDKYLGGESFVNKP